MRRGLVPFDAGDQRSVTALDHHDDRLITTVGRQTVPAAHHRRTDEMTLDRPRPSRRAGGAG